MQKFECIAGLGEVWIFIINFACAIAGCLLATLIIVKSLKRVLHRSSRVDDAVAVFILSAVKVSCFAILFSIILQMLGVSISTIFAVLGAAGAAIALALRDSLANIAGGIMIIATRPFKKGDIVSVGDDRGIVEEIGLFLTTLRTTDYKTITIPNGKMNTSVLYNESNREIRRVDADFSVSCDTDIDRAKEILKNVCEQAPLILDEPKPRIGLAEYEDSGLMIEVLAYCRSEDYGDARYYLNETVKVAFDEAGIEIPYPHIDVKLTRR